LKDLTYPWLVLALASFVVPVLYTVKACNEMLIIDHLQLCFKLPSFTLDLHAFITFVDGTRLLRYFILAAVVGVVVCSLGVALTMFICWRRKSTRLPETIAVRMQDRNEMSFNASNNSYDDVVCTYIDS
jgi:hypothetical protein